MTGKPFKLLVSLAVVLGALALLVRLGGGEGGPAAPTAGVATPPHPEPAPPGALRSPPPAPAAGEPAAGAEAYLAPSLRGTEIDGGLEVDAAGNLLLTEDVRALFDYFLSVHGELELEEIVRALEGHILAELEGGAAEQALELLANYIAYSEHMQGYLQQALVPVEQQTQQYYVDTLAQTLDQLVELRRHYLGPAAADAFFGVEEAYARFTVERMRLHLDDSLSLAEKQQHTDALREQLPAELADVDRRSGLHAELARRTQELREQGADAPALHALRLEYLGEEAAAELARADLEREQWLQRFAAYRRDKEIYLAADGLSEQDRQREQQRLLERHFPAAEHALVRSYEAFAD